MGDKVGVLNNGRVVQVGTPQDIYNHPRNTFVASFVGSPSINLLEGEIHEGRISAFADRMHVPLNGSAAAKTQGASGPVTLGIRSEDIHVGEGDLKAQVHDVENHGVEKIVTLKVDKQLFKATVPATTPIHVDESVGFVWNADKLHCFDRRTGRNLAAAS